MKKKNFRQWDRIPHRRGAIREECLSANSLEYVLLTAHRNPALYDLYQEHFLVCEKCMGRIRKMEKFYSILHDELGKPASPKLRELARSLVKSV